MHDIVVYVMLLISISIVNPNDEYRDVMKTFSYTFGLEMFECGDKMNYTQEIAEDILHFWDEEHPLDNVWTGCLIICAMVKLKLLNDEGVLIRPHAEAYVRANGADEVMVTYLVELYSKCRNNSTTIRNVCKISLEVSKCFRQGIFQKNWTPDISSLMTIPYSRRHCPNK